MPVSPNITLEQVEGKQYKIVFPGLPKGDAVISITGLPSDAPITGFTEEIVEHVIPPFTSDYEVIHDFETDGAYQVTSVTDPPQPEDTIYTLIVSEDVNAALLASIEQLLCTCGCSEWKKGKKEEAMYYFNSLAINYYAYLSIVNEQTVDAFLFGILDPNQLQDVACLQKIIDRINELATCSGLITDPCEDCNCD